MILFDWFAPLTDRPRNKRTYRLAEWRRDE
jgi:hypothetical protein